MKHVAPAHKHVGDAGKPGQIINHDMMDDMSRYAGPASARMVDLRPSLQSLTRLGNPLTAAQEQEAESLATWGWRG